MGKIRNHGFDAVVIGGGIAGLQAALDLPEIPERMECFDISTIQGQATVASLAVVVDGEPAPAEYRHYRVKTVSGNDDYAALREVLQRRLRRGIDESSLPDFILVDGGRGQLGVLTAVLDDLNLAGFIDIAGIAKSRVKANVRGRAVERSEERFFIPGRKNPVLLRRGSAALFLLERLRADATDATEVGDWQKGYVEELVKRGAYAFDLHQLLQYEQ